MLSKIDDDEFYPCLVRKHKSGHVYEVEYEDMESERIDLSTERFRIIGGKQKDAGGGDRKPPAKKVSTAKKRKQVLEDTDEEMEFEGSSSEEDSGDESGSESKGDGESTSESEEAAAEAPPSAKVRRGNSAARAKVLSKICVGTKLAVFWPGEFLRLQKHVAPPRPARPLLKTNAGAL